VVLAQGKTPMNGPHQGAWVETQSGESWFIHFQDKGAYGRVVHLQPMKWVSDWPIIGADGEPVLTYKKPDVGRAYPVATPADSDEFNESQLGLQWQWHGNPKPNWAFPAGGLGFMRLFSIPLPDGFKNLWDAPNLLLQKFPAPAFTATTKLTFTPQADGDQVGLIVMGLDYASVGLRKSGDALYLSYVSCKDADRGTAAKESEPVRVSGNTFYLRVRVAESANTTFSYSTDGAKFLPLGSPFTARQGRWIGAKVGIFALGMPKSREYGYADFDWFRVE
jgi:beta-xylosidase